MASDSYLSAVYLRHLRHGERSRHDARSSPVDDAALDARLAEIVAEARAARPAVEVAPDVFVAYLAERWSPEEALTGEGPLGPLRPADLYLACGCAVGCERARGILEDQYIAGVDAGIARLRLSAAEVDETKQQLRARLLLADEGRTAGRIADYSGHGDLHAWVRAAAVRIALRLAPQPRNRELADSAVLRAVAAPEDLELEYLKRRHAADLENALREAFGRMPARDRNLLRYYYAKHVGIDGLAALYRVHRATAARRVRRTTVQLVDSARELLAARLHADRAEISSLLRLIDSRVNGIFQRALGTSP